MAGGIFLIQPNGDLVEMGETGYDSESILQELLTKYPNLLAGDQIDRASPRKWLLVKREKSIPGDQGASGRWSVDHLFLDQDGTPTLVEVKRSTDTRIRREVVGQMLDYAANAVAYWPIGELRDDFARTWESDGRDPDTIVAGFLSDNGDADLPAFWERVGTKLQTGDVRMIFVADVIPKELQRIVEFLNEQMNPAQVLAVEIRQFIGQGQTAMVPRVLGLTAEAEQKRNSGRTGQRLTETTFFETLSATAAPAEVAIARSLHDWFGRTMTRIDYGIAKCAPRLVHGGVEYCLVQVSASEAFIEVEFGDLAKRPAFQAEAAREEFRRRLNGAGAAIGTDRIANYPRFGLSRLSDATALAKFSEALEWAVEVIKQS